MRTRLGYWDTVRVGADSELINRMRVVFGPEAVAELPTGPLSFQRSDGGSITGDAVLGNGLRYHYGARLHYAEAQSLHHMQPDQLRYSGNPDDRAFPAPLIMLPDRTRQRDLRFDIVLGADFRAGSPAAEQAVVMRFTF